MDGDILGTIGNYGFPMAIAIYLLVRVEGKMDKLTESVTQLTNTLAMLLQNKEK